MRFHVAFLLFVSLLAIVFPKGNEGYNQEKYEEWEYYIRDHFADFDKNKDGYIDTEEFSDDQKPEYVEYAFKRFDVDGDGKMNYEEFTEEWLSLLPTEKPSSDTSYTKYGYQKPGKETAVPYEL